MSTSQKYTGYMIDFVDFYMVQGEKGRRRNKDEDTGKRKAARYSSQNVLSGLLVCAECGANYRRISRSTGAVWRCANHVEHGKQICRHAPSIAEAQLKANLCKLSEMDSFNELKVAEMIDTIFIQENGALEIEYKGQGFSQSVVLGPN